MVTKEAIVIYLEHLARAHGEELRRQAGHTLRRARRPGSTRPIVGRLVGLVR